jgi:hypothetical protein
MSVEVNNSGVAQGGWSYDGGGSFPLTGSTPGSVIKAFAVAWNSAFATPQAAAVAGSFLGYSSTFSYQTGPDRGAAVSSFAFSGMPAFGFGIPEPSPAALMIAGLADLLLSRRQLPCKV